MVCLGDFLSLVDNNESSDVIIYRAGTDKFLYEGKPFNCPFQYKLEMVTSVFAIDKDLYEVRILGGAND